MYDIILTGGLVVDGSGKQPYTANVCIEGGKIACITSETPEAKETVDVSGLAVTPGFIDTHSHADIAHLKDYPVYSQVAQGVTTEIAGNCGTSIMPAFPEKVEEMIKVFDESKITVDVTLPDVLNNSATMYVVAYNTDGEMIKLYLCTQIEASNQFDTVKDIASVKAFIWDANMVPLTK